MAISPNNISCVVRTIGERTTDACISLLGQFFGPDRNIHIVNTQPFDAALSESLHIGIDSDKDWTLIIDADILSTPERMGIFFASLNNIPDNTFMIHASAFDRFFARYRCVGNRLYNNKYLCEALNCIPAQHSSLRPESSMCRSMLLRGYRNFQSSHIIGLHDYEQYYIDILRKVVLFAIKHPQWRDHFESLWQSRHDMSDYVAALEALSAANLGGVVEISGALLKRLPEDTLRKWQAQEKAPLGAELMTSSVVEKLIDTELEGFGLKVKADTEMKEYKQCAA